jgi:acetoin utilization protein AcuB
MMREGQFRHLPVTYGGNVVGVVTDRDIKLLVGPECGNPDEQELKVRDAYVDRPCVVAASTPLAAVARAMAEHHIGSAVVTKNDKLVGIFTVTDACRALAEILEGHPAETDSAA